MVIKKGSLSSGCLNIMNLRSIMSEFSRYYDSSSTAASGAFFLTEAIPFSIAEVLEYISLAPIA